MVKKAQASTAVDSGTVSTTHSTDDFPGEEAQSCTSFENDKEDDGPPFPSSSLHDVLSTASTAEAAALPQKVLEVLVHVSPLLLSVRVTIRRCFPIVLLVPELLFSHLSIIYPSL